MRRASIAISIAALTLALPLAAQTPTDPLVPAPAKTAETAKTVAREAGTPEAGPRAVPESSAAGAVQEAGSCSSGSYFLVLVEDDNPILPCGPICDDACQQGGGTSVFSFFDRVYCNCLCCEGS